MMRRTCQLAAATIPRDAWDPSRHHPKHIDSYAQHLVDRRQWPAKKWSVGLEPRTPKEWLKFSNRNLAYAYNGAMRACVSFPEMIPLYQEMKQRGVKVDVDTMVTLLSRAARYEKITSIDIFKLFDELLQHGAKPDQVVVEILHTVWDTSVSMDAVEREARRLQMLELYDRIGRDYIDTLGPKNVPNLLRSNISRIRDNMETLNGTLNPSTWKKYIGQIQGFDLLLLEVNNFLWSYAADGAASTELQALKMNVPALDSLKRPTAASQSNTSSVFDTLESRWDDAVINDVLLSALQRIIDHPLSGFQSQRNQLFMLINVIFTSKVLLGPKLMEQVMDVVKFSTEDSRRDADAMKYMQYAIRVTSHRESNNESRHLWLQENNPISAPLVGRYLAARDPWGAQRFNFSGTKFDPFPVAEIASGATPTKSAAAGQGEDGAEKTKKPAGEDFDDSAETTEKKSTVRKIRTARDVDIRMQDVEQLIVQTKVLENSRIMTTDDAKEGSVEVFTGKLAVLRRMITGEPYAIPNDYDVNDTSAQYRLKKAAATAAAEFNVEVAAKVFTYTSNTKFALDAHCEEYGLQPELEAWESCIMIANYILDQLTVIMRTLSKEGKANAEPLFAEVLKFRENMVHESSERFGGRFRMLWLQEV